jgi:hypothetical protein
MSSDPIAPSHARPAAGAGRAVRAPWPAATALLLAISTLFPAAAAGFVALDLGQRLTAAHDAVVGVVVAIDVEVRDGEPWTVVTIDLEAAWRLDGERVRDLDAGETTLSAAFWGGRAPGATPLQVAGMPTFTVGERVLWLLRARDAGLAAPTVGVTQGVWRESEGTWRGDDGSVLGVDESGDLVLAAPPTPDGVLFEALDAAFDALEPTP